MTTKLFHIISGHIATWVHSAFHKLRHPTRGFLQEPVLATSVAHLKSQVQQAATLGWVNAQAAEIASRALTFGDVKIAQLMVPRHRVQALPIDADPAQLRRLLLEERYSRVPVYQKNLDRIVGILVAKDALSLVWGHQLIVLQDLLLPPYFAPETMLAVDLLRELQRRQQHFAVVVDEMGQTAGIITLEDLLEELVGDIVDDHAHQTDELIHHESDGSVMVEGMLPVREANRELALTLPEGEAFTTVAGLCVSLAGKIPETGVKLTIDEATTLEVVEASARSVVRVRLARVPRAAKRKNITADKTDIPVQH